MVMMDREEYEQILRSVIVADFLLSRNSGRKGRAADEISRLQQRLFDEAERFGITWTDGERERFAEDCLREIDSFVAEETWDELAWWIAEREYKRWADGSRDTDAKDLITHRYYHEIMEEFQRHGISNLEISGLKLSGISPETVRAALSQFKKETSRKT